MNVLLAHPGTQHSARLAAELYRRGLLGLFHTGFAVPEGGLLDRMSAALPPSWKRRLANRSLTGVPARAVRLHPWAEGAATIARKAGRPSQCVYHARNRYFQQRIPARDIASCAATIGFDTSGWILAERCRNAAKPFVLDQSTGHPDSKLRIFDRLRERYPAWSGDAEVRLPQVRDAEQVEHTLATRIVAASTFARQTLIDNGVAESKIRVNPYGVDASRFVPQQRRAGTPLRFCFVGAMSVRKGLAQLLDVWRAIAARDAELWLVGPAADGGVERFIRGHERVVYKGAVPQRELPAIFGQCDVFVFPSFFDGFGLVILEAMACGLPVIATTSSGGPDVIRDGENGWLVPPGDDAALVAAIGRCLANPEQARAMGAHARSTAETFTWQKYGERWDDILREVALA